MYTTKHAQILFRVASPQTIRNWAKEFEEYLSPTATPEKGNTRYFTMEDMRVFDLIADYSDQNKPFVDIHAALKSGERGNEPTIAPEDLDGLAAGEIEMQLSTELDEARLKVTELESELQEIKSRFQPVREENIRLKAQIEDREQRLQELKEELQSAQEKITKLAEEKGDAYVRGVMDAMKRKMQDD